MKKGYLDPEIERRIREANRRFREEQQRKLLERLRGFKPLDEQSRRFFRLAGWDYCEDLSALVQALVEGQAGGNIFLINFLFLSP